MSYENNLKVLTHINLNNDLLEYSKESFHKIGFFKKNIYLIKNIFYKLFFSNKDVYENCRLHFVSHKIHEFLNENQKNLTKKQFAFIKNHFEVLREKAIKRKKDYVGDLAFVNQLIQKLEKTKINTSHPSKPSQKKTLVEPDFIGINALVKKQKNQLNQFIKWKQKKQWSSLHNSHFDWWMFPINQKSRGQGGKYTLNINHIKSLSKNPTFISDYRKGVNILLEAWGWNIKNHKTFSSSDKNQGWNDHDVRLAKVLQSLKLFNQNDLLKEVQDFAKKLIHDTKLKPSKWLKSLL